MILFTANEDVAAPFLQINQELKENLLHVPLENFTYHTLSEEEDEILERFSEFTFIIHGNLRNARYFTEWMKQNSVEKEVVNCINLTLDKPTASFLEQNGIPAIQPREHAKPIDILEFMLRISREGITLYPTTEQKSDEMPGLLLELQMPIAEFTVCREASLQEKQLKLYRKEVSEADVDTVLIHTRSAYNRIKAAFPDLDLSQLRVIAGSPGVEELLRKEGIESNSTAYGSWYSLAKTVQESVG
jgi:uroporphyrinogen-III synthase